MQQGKSIEKYNREIILCFGYLDIYVACISSFCLLLFSLNHMNGLNPLFVIYFVLSIQFLVHLFYFKLSIDYLAPVSFTWSTLVSL